MQSCSMTLSSSVRAADASVVSASVDEVALPNAKRQKCCEDNTSSRSKETQETISTGDNNQQIVTLAIVATVCVVSIVILFASAFVTDDPNTLESSADCDDSVTSETSRTIMAFVMGWAFCLIAKQRENLVGHMSEFVCSTRQLSASVCSSASSFMSAVTFPFRNREGWFVNQGPMVAKMLGLAMVGTLCAGCIIGLFISAFTIVPGAEPTDTSFASESSETVKAFTVGWIFLLSFKLRGELVGVVGSSCLLQPC